MQKKSCRACQKSRVKKWILLNLQKIYRSSLNFSRHESFLVIAYSHIFYWFWLWLIAVVLGIKFIALMFKHVICALSLTCINFCFALTYLDGSGLTIMIFLISYHGSGLTFKCLDWGFHLIHLVIFLNTSHYCSRENIKIRSLMLLLSLLLVGTWCYMQHNFLSFCLSFC